MKNLPQYTFWHFVIWYQNLVSIVTYFPMILYPASAELTSKPCMSESFKVDLQDYSVENLSVPVVVEMKSRGEVISK